MLLGLLVYGYASGVHSSRKIERATYDSVALRYVAANTHPDHDTLATFRRRFLEEIEALFVQVLVLAREMKLLKLGHIALDGTKIKANASKHTSLSWAHANRIEAQLREEVQTRWRWPRRPIARACPTAWTCRPRSPGATIGWGPSRKPRPQSSSARPSGIRSSNRSSRPNRPSTKRSAMRARSLAARSPSRPRPAPRMAIRSI